MINYASMYQEYMGFSPYMEYVTGEKYRKYKNNLCIINKIKIAIHG